MTKLKASGAKQTKANPSRCNKEKIDRSVHTVRMTLGSVEKIVLTWMVTQRGRLNITFEMKLTAEGVKQGKLRSMSQKRQAGDFIRILYMF